MSVVLHHTIVPVTDKKAGARFFANLLGLQVREDAGPFVPVRVNADLTFDFDDRHRVHAGHYAFLLDDDTFDAVLDRLDRDPAIDYGSGPRYGWDRQVNHLGGGRGIYIRDPDGHSYELFTAAG
jgi:catechol 2,3-dioxygenase-like lactoylglutathione lyase family enzyme